MFHSFFTATSKTSLVNRESNIDSSNIKSSNAGKLLSMQDIHISHGHKTLLKIDKLTVPVCEGIKKRYQPDSVFFIHRALPELCTGTLLSCNASAVTGLPE